MCITNTYPLLLFFFSLALSGICSANILILKRFLKETFVELFYRHYQGPIPARKILNHCWKSPGSSANPQAFVPNMYLPCLLAWSLQLLGHKFSQIELLGASQMYPNCCPLLSPPPTDLRRLLTEVHDIELICGKKKKKKKVWFYSSKWKSSLTHPVEETRNQHNWAWRFDV